LGLKAVGSVMVVLGEDSWWKGSIGPGESKGIGVLRLREPQAPVSLRSG
jgi:hypothetical protein